MNRQTEEELKVSLTRIIQRWLESDDAGDRTDMPYLGAGAAEAMASAALAVLRGIADAQEHLEQEGMLKDD